MGIIDVGDLAWLLVVDLVRGVISPVDMGAWGE